MKKIFLISLILTLLLVSHKIFSQSYLQLSLYDDGDFSVVFDNSDQSSIGNVAEFDNISAGEHTLKVIKASMRVPAQGDVIFSGTIKIPAGFSVYAVIDEYNSFAVYKKVEYARGRASLDGNYYNKCSTGKNDNDIKFNQKDPVNDPCRFKIIKKDDFNSLKKDINSRNFESSNMDVLKDALDKNIFSSDQVRELLGYFTFENSKLEIAKYAYKNTCDKNNYFKLFDAFTFDSSVQELKNYISGK